jgi:hypothetical protein
MEIMARNFSAGGEAESPDADRDIAISIPSPRKDLRLTIQLGSTEFTILRPLFGRRIPLRPDRLPRIPVLRIEGHYAPSAADAREFLERIGNAILFQIDLRSDIPLFLSRPLSNTLGSGEA